MIILLTRNATNTLDRVYTDRSIYNTYGHFTHWFIKWNYTFHQYVRESVLGSLTASHGVFAIGHIGSLDYQIRYLRGVKHFIIIRFSFPTFMYTSRVVPRVDVAKSPRYWPKPTKTAFVLPPKTRVLKGEYFNGLRVGFHHRKYTILDAEGKPLVEAWFDKKPRFFKYPFGKLGIIAHVSYQKELYAISMDGKMYNMDKMWKDAYLYEVFMHIMNNIINETFSSYKRQMLFESRSKVIRLNETQLCIMIHSIINKLIA